MLNPIPAFIDASNIRFQATERGVMSIERHNNVRDVVARKALMLFCRRPSRSLQGLGPSLVALGACVASHHQILPVHEEKSSPLLRPCRFASCDRRDECCKAGINQIARMNNGEVYGKMVGSITSKTAVVAIPNRRRCERKEKRVIGNLSAFHTETFALDPCFTCTFKRILVS